MNKKYIVGLLLSVVIIQNALIKSPMAAPNIPNVGTKQMINVSLDSLNVITSDMAQTLTQISNLEKQEIILGDKIQQTEVELEDIVKKNKELEKHFDDMCRNTYMYNTDGNIVVTILTSDSISDLYYKAKASAFILDYNKKVMKEFEESKKKLELLKGNLENEKEELEINKEEQSSKLKELEDKKKEIELELKKQERDLNLMEKASSDGILNTLQLSNVKDIRKNIITLGSSFLGMPYQWGGANPSTSFDCSGLVQYVYGQLGLHLPRTSQEQQQVGTVVSVNEATPGDLVFFNTPATHVGIYVGNGYMLHAPKTGDHIKISSINNPTNIKRVIND